MQARDQASCASCLWACARLLGAQSRRLVPVRTKGIAVGPAATLGLAAGIAGAGAASAGLNLNVLPRHSCSRRTRCRWKGTVQVWCWAGRHAAVGRCRLLLTTIAWPLQLPAGACRTNCGSCESWRPIHIRGAMRELRSPCPAFLPRPRSDALRYRARSRPPCLHAWPSKASEAMQAAGSEPRAITGLNRDSECPPLLLVKVCAVNRPLQCSHGVSHNSEPPCRRPPPRRGLDP